MSLSSYRIYLIPGLGADERVFQYLSLPESNAKVIRWIKPGNTETLADYAHRLTDQITEKDPVIIGVSFGGMIAAEMSKVINTRKTILISSAKNSNSVPQFLKTISATGLIRLLPPVLFRSPNFILHYLFGTSGSAERKLLNTITKETDPAFVKWALTAIANWDSSGSSKNVITIHGDNDRLIPSKSADYTISNGGHFMIVTKAYEISRLLLEILR